MDRSLIKHYNRLCNFFVAYTLIAVEKKTCTTVSVFNSLTYPIKTRCSYYVKYICSMMMMMMIRKNNEYYLIKFNCAEVKNDLPYALV